MRKLKKYKSIGELFNSLLPYLLTIGVNKETVTPYVVVIIPKNWKIKIFNFNYDVIEDTGNAYIVEIKNNSTDDFDKLISDVQLLITFNIEIQNKENIFKQKLIDEEQKIIEKLKNEPILTTNTLHELNEPIENNIEKESDTFVRDNKIDISFLNEFREES